MTTQHYVEYAYPGIITSDLSSQSCEHRDPTQIFPNKMCYAFRFYDRTEEDTGEEVLIGKPRDYSGWYFVHGSRFLTLAEVKREIKNNRTIVANMENNNNIRRVVQTIHGQFIPASENDEILR